MSDLPLVAAFDVASTSGICWGRPGETPLFETVKFTRDGDDDLDPSWRAMTWAIRWIKEHQPDKLFIEQPLPAGSRGGRTSPEAIVRLNGLYHCIGAVAKAKRILVRPVNLQTARKLFIGSGNLPGEQTKRMVLERCEELGWRPQNNDEGDAGCVWFYACHMLQPGIMSRLGPVFLPMQGKTAKQALGKAA